MLRSLAGNRTCGSNAVGYMKIFIPFMAVGPGKSQCSRRDVCEMFGYLRGPYCEPQPQAGCSPTTTQPISVTPTSKTYRAVQPGRLNWASHSIWAETGSCPDSVRWRRCVLSTSGYMLRVLEAKLEGDKKDKEKSAQTFLNIDFGVWLY